MIVESSNTSAKSDPGTTTDHLLKGAKNERILTLQGSALMVRHMTEDARRFGKANAFCHAKIAPDPEHPLTPEELLKVAKDYAEARGFDDRDALIVAHKKDGHWHAHAVFRLVDPLTGRVARTSWDYLQNERFSRLFEHDHGHRITRGQHTPSVCRALVKEGRPEAAQAIRAAVEAKPEPGPALSFQDMQRSDRLGLDKQSIKQIVSQAYEAAQDRQQFTAALAKQGWSVVPGDKLGVLLLVDEAGRELGNLQRLSPARKKAFQAFWEKPLVDPETLPVVTLPPPLPEVPPQPQAPSVIPEQKPTPTLQQELHNEHSDPATLFPSPAVEARPSRPDSSGAITVRVRYRADLEGTGAAPDGQSGGTGAGSGRRTARRRPASLRDPAEAKRRLEEVRANRNQTHTFVEQNRGGYQKNGRSASRLRLALLKYRAKVRVLAARFGVNVEVVRQSLSAKIAINTNGTQQQIEYSGDVGLKH